MKRSWLCVLMLLMGVVMSEGGERIGVTMKGGRAYLPAVEMEGRWGVAVKRLPGADPVAACFRDRCALVREHVGEGKDLMLGVEAVLAALGLEPDWSEDRLEVGFGEGNARPPVPGVVTGVGELAPNFRLRRLDGSGTISLGELRGKRVLINSWASW